ncbi:MAG TPA: alkaline phosphatase family protein [Clostridia bacterium]|nr:alkaline phosphatase family protein [Clostridia bacterium]
MKTIRILKFLTAVTALVAMLPVACRGPMTVDNSGLPFGGGNPNVPTQSPIKHLIVVVMQNRSFDHLFGQFQPGNGQTVDGLRPGVPGFTQTDANGNSFSPFLLTNGSSDDLAHGHNDYLESWNHGAMDGFVLAQKTDVVMGYFDASIPGISTLWDYARQFALSDRYYSSVLSSAPAQMFYAVSATDNGQPFSTQPVFGPCQSPDPAAYENTARNVGDQMSSRDIGWAWFHERLGACGDYVPQQNPFQYFTTTHNSEHIQDLSAFTTVLDAGQLPSVSFVQPAPSHSGHPGSSSITAGITWLDGFVKQVQASSSWDTSAIVVLWDEGGGWYDHSPPPQVDSEGLGIRVPMLVISPFAKKGVVVHELMDHTSLLKFIQWNWGLPALNGRNSIGSISDLRPMFAF